MSSSKQVAKEAQAKRLCVLKFGSSVLEREEDYPKVVHEIYRHVRNGEKVVAVVSALAGETDALLAQARRVGGDKAPGALVARLARVGELQSAALMALALSKAGLRAWTLDPQEMALDAVGSPLDSNLTRVDAEAEKASSGLIQVKAIHAAAEKDVLIEVAALGSAEATTIANLPAAKSRPPRPERLRVALLGCGSVGKGVLDLLLSQPELFEVGPVLVRTADRHSENVKFTQSLDEALAGEPDVLIEVLGGSELAAEAMHSALLRGAQIVTANKAAVAKHWDSLHACAARNGGELRYSAAVGGGAPVIETLRRLSGSVVSVEGVMNGTCNYLLSRLAEGTSLEKALAKAQELGFAEADPSADVDGHDAADKLSILVREAFGVAVVPQLIAKHSLRDLVPEAAMEALDRGEVLKQVGRCHLLPDGTVEAEVQVVALPLSHPLAGARDEENRFLITDAEGNVHEVFGKGAGRWPTATSVFADVMDAQRALLGRAPVEASKTLKLRA